MIYFYTKMNILLLIVTCDKAIKIVMKVNKKKYKIKNMKIYFLYYSCRKAFTIFKNIERYIYKERTTNRFENQILHGVR